MHCCPELSRFQIDLIKTWWSKNNCRIKWVRTVVPLYFHPVVSYFCCPQLCISLPYQILDTCFCFPGLSPFHLKTLAIKIHQPLMSPSVCHLPQPEWFTTHSSPQSSVVNKACSSFPQLFEGKASAACFRLLVPLTSSLFFWSMNAKFLSAFLYTFGKQNKEYKPAWLAPAFQF